MILTGRFRADRTTNGKRPHPSAFGPNARSLGTDFLLDLELFSARKMLVNASFGKKREKRVRRKLFNRKGLRLLSRSVRSTQSSCNHMTANGLRQNPHA